MSGSPGDAPVLELRNIGKRFHDAKTGRPWTVFQDVTFTIPPRSFTSIVGPSGCGKSTLLNLCAGLMSPDMGELTFKNEALRGVNTDAGYVTQDANLLPWLTVEQNIRLPLEIRGYSKAERQERTARWIELVGLTGFESYYPGQLSGGMQKRCSIARTLVYDPDLVLMDEPFGPLDAITRQVLQQELLDIWEPSGKVVVFVTHDLQEAIALSDQIVVMTRNPGTVEQVFPVMLTRPRDVFHVTEDPGYASLHRALWEIVATNLGRQPRRHSSTSAPL